MKVVEKRVGGMATGSARRIWDRFISVYKCETVNECVKEKKEVMIKWNKDEAWGYIAWGPGFNFQQSRRGIDYWMYNLDGPGWNDGSKNPSQKGVRMFWCNCKHFTHVRITKSRKGELACGNRTGERVSSVFCKRTAERSLVVPERFL